MSQTLDMLDDMLLSASKVLAHRPLAPHAALGPRPDARGAVLADLRAQVDIWRSLAPQLPLGDLQPQALAEQLERAIDLIEGESFSPINNSNERAHP